MFLALTLAQTLDAAPAPEPAYQYKPVTEIDFGTLAVGAEIIKPDLKLIEVSEHKGFNPLIRLRADFDAELGESVNYVK